MKKRKRKSGAKTGDAQRMHFARQKRTISRQGRMDHVSNTGRTYRKGKRKMSRSGWQRIALVPLARGVGTNARKRESKKIRERAFTCVENLDRYRSRGRYTGIGRTPGNKYNKGSGDANDAEWTKSAVSVEREGRMKGATEIKEKIPPRVVGKDKKKVTRRSVRGQK